MDTKRVPHTTILYISDPDGDALYHWLRHRRINTHDDGGSEAIKLRDSLAITLGYVNPPRKT